MSIKFDQQVVKAQKEIEEEKSKYQKLLSEKRLIEEKLEIYERKAFNASGDGLKLNGSDLSLTSYQENEYSANRDSQKVSC